MKSTKVILAVAGIFVAGVAAQVPPNFPACGDTCIKNMINQAPDLGCPQGAADPLCLCNNARFNYGIRDCANEACANDTAAGIVIAYGAAYCRSNSATAELPMTQTATTTGTGGVTSAAAPVPTGVSVTTIVSGGSTTVSTISPTSGTDASSTPAASSFTSVITSNGTPVTSTGVASDTGSAPTSSGGASSSGGAASSTNGVVPRQTAAPAGLLAVAGVAVLFL